MNYNFIILTPSGRKRRATFYTFYNADDRTQKSDKRFASEVRTRAAICEPHFIISMQRSSPPSDSVHSTYLHDIQIKCIAICYYIINIDAITSTDLQISPATLYCRTLDVAT